MHTEAADGVTFLKRSTEATSWHINFLRDVFTQPLTNLIRTPIKGLRFAAKRQKTQDSLAGARKQDSLAGARKHKTHWQVLVSMNLGWS